MTLFKYKLLDYLKWKLYKDYPRLSYSRAGEDSILLEIFGQKENGVYIDIGCYHPIEGSNTYRFYQNGWSGINIDPSHKAIALFNSTRPRDKNIHAAVDVEEGEIEYYTFKEKGFDQMNTISESFKDFAVNEFHVTIDNTHKVQRFRLEHLLDQHLDPGRAIDFFSVDVEGKDLEVLQSNNWTKYRPRVVVAEVTGKLIELSSLDVTKFMESVGYEPIAFNLVNLDRGNIFFYAKTNFLFL